MKAVVSDRRRNPSRELDGRLHVGEEIGWIFIAIGVDDRYQSMTKRHIHDVVCCRWKLSQKSGYPMSIQQS